jgi:2OG-Fe(II) oxygenase superfamily
MDGLFEVSVLKQIENEFPPLDHPLWIRMENKWEYKYASEQPGMWGRGTRELLKYLTSQEFLNQLEYLTGLSGLMSDPTYRGGGLHQIPAGGYLKIHTDFNEHNGVFKGKGWIRRLNLLVYLNSHWKEEWGGDFEIWSPDGSSPVTRISPLFNRTVVFETTSMSFHGHPSPLRCPETTSRKSLALYYYTLGTADNNLSVRTRFVAS